MEWNPGGNFSYDQWQEVLTQMHDKMRAAEYKEYCMEKDEIKRKKATQPSDGEWYWCNIENNWQPGKNPDKPVTVITHSCDMCDSLDGTVSPIRVCPWV